MFCIVDIFTKEILIQGHINSSDKLSECITLNSTDLGEYVDKKDGLELYKWHDDNPLTEKILAPYKRAFAVLNEAGKIIDVEIEPLPPEGPQIEPADPEKVAMAEAIIDLEARLSELEGKLNA